MSKRKSANAESVSDDTTWTRPTEVIYADRVIGGGFGSQVSRIQLGMEMGNGETESTTCIVIPTPELLKLMASAIEAFKQPEVTNQFQESVNDMLAAIKKFHI